MCVVPWRVGCVVPCINKLNEIQMDDAHPWIEWQQWPPVSANVRVFMPVRAVDRPKSSSSFNASAQMSLNRNVMGNAYFIRPKPVRPSSSLSRNPHAILKILRQ